MSLNDRSLYDQKLTPKASQVPLIGKSRQQVQEGAEQSDCERVNSRRKAKFEYSATSENELSVKANEIVSVTEKHENGWYLATNSEGASGFVPGDYLTSV